ncbi:MAG: site-specific integrase [Candidatus Acidiferrales bacterium]
MPTGRGRRPAGIEKPPFYVRVSVNGKQSWDGPYPTLEEAQAASPEAVAARLAWEQENANRTLVKAAIEQYLEQKAGKTKNTVQQYHHILSEFAESLPETVLFIDEVTVDVLRHYQKFLAAKGHAAKTIDTRINIVYFLLKKNSVTARLPRDEMPVIELENAVPYTESELKKLFAAMDEEQRTRYKFFLGTGCRDQEVSFAAWTDIDFDKKVYHVRRKEDVGFTPKSHESRTVPLAESLVELLKARRKKAQHDRWIFVNEEGRPDNHFLRKLKRIALRAGLNCGQCRTTIRKGKYEGIRSVEVTCKTDPVCEHFYLHRFRKTCATRWHASGVPVRTIQAWLGHKNLETTMIYLGVADVNDPRIRKQINDAFGD